MLHKIWCLLKGDKILRHTNLETVKRFNIKSNKFLIVFIYLYYHHINHLNHHL